MAAWMVHGSVALLGVRMVESKVSWLAGRMVAM